MPLKLLLHSLAQRDLSRLIDFIARQSGSFEVAEKFADRILDRCLEVTGAPGTGAPYAPNRRYRKVVEGVYKIIYREEGSAIVVYRIWDGRRGSEPRLGA